MAWYALVRLIGIGYVCCHLYTRYTSLVQDLDLGVSMGGLLRYRGSPAFFFSQNLIPIPLDIVQTHNDRLGRTLCFFLKKK